MKKIKTVTFTFDRNDFPKKGEWFFSGYVYSLAAFDFEETKHDICTKTETEEVWKPKAEEVYYYISPEMDVIPSAWFNDIQDKAYFNIGNCFQTEAEAQAMADKFKELLKGGAE